MHHTTRSRHRARPPSTRRACGPDLRDRRARVPCDWSRDRVRGSSAWGVLRRQGRAAARRPTRCSAKPRLLLRRRSGSAGGYIAAGRLECSTVADRLLLSGAMSKSAVPQVIASPTTARVDAAASLSGLRCASGGALRGALGPLHQTAAELVAREDVAALRVRRAALADRWGPHDLLTILRELLREDQQVLVLKDLHSRAVDDLRELEQVPTAGTALDVRLLDGRGIDGRKADDVAFVVADDLQDGESVHVTPPLSASAHAGRRRS